MPEECQICFNAATTTVYFSEPKYQAFIVCDEHRDVALTGGASVLVSSN